MPATDPAQIVDILQEKELHLRTPLEELTDMPEPPRESDDDGSDGTASAAAADGADVGLQSTAADGTQLPEFDEA